MRDVIGGGRSDVPGDSVGSAVDPEWGELAAGLADYLAVMVDPDETDHLVIELIDPDPEGAGCPPYAQFAAFDEGRMIYAEISGNAYLAPGYALDDDADRRLRAMGWQGNDDAEKNWYSERPVDESAQTADEVVWALRHLFGIAHPHLLTRRSWGPAASEARVLGLCASDEVPTDRPHAPGAESPVFWSAVPDDREGLAQMVGDLLRSRFECDPTVDGDGDFVVEHLGQPVWVRVRADQPAVEVMARVAHDVYSRRATAVELGLLNRDSLWVRWTQRDRSVWQGVVVPGLPFAPAHLDAMLDVFFEAMADTRDDLAYRLRAKVA